MRELLRHCVQSGNERFGVEGIIEESAKDLVLIQCVATLMDRGLRFIEVCL